MGREGGRKGGEGERGRGEGGRKGGREYVCDLKMEFVLDN